ncbi:MAG: hypothetical protein ACYC6Y_19110, partial [Thermoguttaceae bacterium]
MNRIRSHSLVTALVLSLGTFLNAAEQTNATIVSDGMIDLLPAPEEEFDGRIFLINDWDGGDKDNQNAAEELNRNSRIKQGVTIL